MSFDIKNHILQDSSEEICFEIPVNIYPLEAIYQTAYVFTQKHFVSLDGNPKETIQVSLCFKNINDPENKNLAGSFMNELLNQALRLMVNERNKDEKKEVIANALNVNRTQQ